MKICSRCKTEKTLDSFPWRDKKKGRKASWCRKCFSESYRKRYYSDSSTYRDEVNKRRRLRTQSHHKKIFEFFKTHPCVDCGESNPIVLEFDHVTSNKFKEVGRMIGDYYSWKRILEEMQKCEVRCSNCHKIRTAKQFGLYAYMVDVS